MFLIFYRTPLHLVAERGYVQAIQILLENPSIDINITDEILFSKYNQILFGYLMIIYDYLWRTPADIALNEKIRAMIESHSK